MQTFEALLSFMFFVMIASSLMLSTSESPPDDSLYRVQLANDAWRVLYLRGDFEGMGEGKRTVIERDLEEMGAQTGLCYFIDGVEMTNCRGGDKEHEMTVSVRRTLIYDGSPKSVSFSIKK